jgi:hypothetical protein
MILDASQVRAFFNPVTIHALSILDACDDNLIQAREIAGIQFQCGPGDPKHWFAIYSIFLQEGAQA